MAGPEPRVRYLAGFRCPLGGLAAGTARVLRHGAEVFLCTGSEFVYVYDQEGGLLSAVYQFPGRVWHLELLPPRRALYVLCAREGVYCLPLDRPRRSQRQDAEDGEDGEDGELPSPVIPVGPDACVLPGAGLCTFAVLDDALVTLEQGPAQWKVRLLERPCPGQEPRPDAQIGEVELAACTPSAGQPEDPRFLPVLCCLSQPGSGAPRGTPPAHGGFVLGEALFGLLFGADAVLLESPVVLCGLPDGQLCCVVLKALVTSRSAPGDPKALVKILHHLEEPVVFLGALRTEPQARDTAEDGLAAEDMHADCLVALGHHGRALAIKAGWNEAGSLVPELREYRLPGPALCAACGGGGRLFYSTPSDLCVVDLAQGGSRVDPEWPQGAPGGLPPLLCPASLNICGSVALRASAGPGGMSCRVSDEPKLTARAGRCRLVRSRGRWWQHGSACPGPAPCC